jgi:hypothetical protein
LKTPDTRGTSKTLNEKPDAQNDILSKYTQYVLEEPLRASKQQNQQPTQHPGAQKQYQDLMGNEIYEKRPFENQAKCYYCNESFSLKK